MRSRMSHSNYHMESSIPENLFFANKKASGKPKALYDVNNVIGYNSRPSRIVILSSERGGMFFMAI